jgi:hypothetical protein
MMRGIGTATAGVVLIGMMGAGLLPGKADEAKTQYPRMALVEQYTMDRNAEIAMAKSAAPAAIADDPRRTARSEMRCICQAQAQICRLRRKGTLAFIMSRFIST